MSLLDKVNDFSLKIARPMAKLSARPAIAAIQNGLIAATPIILIGSFFLVLFSLASPSVGASGEPLLPFLAPFTDQLLVLFSLTFGVLSLYCAVTISHSYATNLGVDALSATVLGLASFLTVNIGEIGDGGISLANFGAAGLVTTMIVSLLVVRVYKFLLDHKVTIRLPDSIPSNVLNAFTSLVPYFLVLSVLWFIRTILDFDLTVFLSTFLAPVIQGADNIFFFTLNTTMHGLFWTVGLHWDNMVSGVVTPLTTLWTQDNIAAYIAGSPLQHIYTTGLYRLAIVPGIFVPPLILMLVSRLKQLRVQGLATLPATVFSITEPLTFGLLAFNPFFLVPMVVSGFLAGLITYGSTMLGLVPKFYLELPWATPTFIYGIVGTGSFAGLLVQLVVIAVGLCVYFPFFRAYEKNQRDAAALEEAEHASDPETGPSAAPSTATHEKGTQ